MAWPQQYSLRVLLILMLLVAHACSKPIVARSLHAGPIESVSTLTPFAISITFSDENLNEHSKTYVGAFGQYWLYSHEVSILLRTCNDVTEAPE